jgi:integrase
VIARLTDAGIRKYRPAAKRRRIRDALSQSLFLIIEPSGHRSWQMRFRTPTGRIGKLTLGAFDETGRELTGEPTIGQPLTLAAARHLAASVHRDRALGKDVIAEHAARKHRQRVELIDRGKNTFAAAARDYVEDYAKANHRRWPETAGMLGLRPDDLEPVPGGLAARWHDRPIDKIDDHDLWSAIDEATRHGVPGRSARNKGVSEPRGRALHAALSSMFSWLLARRRIPVDPTANLVAPPAAKARERVLTPDEIRWFWQACAAADAPRMAGAPRPFAPMLKLLLLTGARLNEVARMTAEELADDGTWQLPGARTKNGKPHVVPLSPAARDLLAALPGDSGYLFTTTDGRAPVSGWSRMKHRLDAAMLALAKQEQGAKTTVPDWRLHDLRRSAASGMQQLGIRVEVIERALNHISGSFRGVSGTYQRDPLTDDVRDALACWSRFVALVVDQGLHTAHQKLLVSGDDENRKKARKVFNDAVGEGSERWSRYLKMLAGETNVLALPKKKARRGTA